MVDKASTSGLSLVQFMNYARLFIETIHTISGRTSKIVSLWAITIKREIYG